MALPTEGQNKNIAWDSFAAEIDIEIEQTEKELNEISILLEQSEGEVEKLAERNATINLHLQKILTQIDDLPSAETKIAYNAALDSQQRLVVMRSQLEKLKSEQKHLNRYFKIVLKVKQAIDEGAMDGSDNSSSQGKFAAAEMMIQAQEAERQRLSQKIHDGPAQTLSNFILQTEIALRLFEIDQSKAKEELGELKASASNTFQQVRDFIFDLRPMMLDDLGLVPTVKRYVEAYREKSAIAINLSVTGQDRRIESYLEVMIFRAMQELINYCSNQGQADQLNIQFDMGLDNARLNMEDNGKGYEENAHPEESTIGIKMIKERADMIGGSFEIESFEEGGTQFTLNVPI
ncbi:MAG: sensor histidine kinase [Chloroflexi bacterium]|jgi:two-component system, NarL family, sensor histidine kinase DegS|nr:sensor histidine kinase [Chloroflexota bacterium]MBT3670797.1 sensor histidine kinase [Chloroflexota bacterium]MBT4002078.1 sensor histidine kinase [Chloroflexota bacterium]MBT4305606.1 sensor histidine kinase [Chloroflexota bacterium]MBT4533313.1 sensor histidine kinase [Chloroflexota bacterium]